MAPVVEVATKSVTLGEGPHWDVKNQCLYFVDIFGRAIHKYVPSTNTHTKAKIEGGRVTLLVPVEGTSDRFLISIERKLVIATWNGVSETPSKIEDLLEIETERSVTSNRFNDGKADPAGRLWAGTMGTEVSPGKFDPGKGSLYTLVGKKQIRKELPNLTISNGLAWDVELKKMYFIDSPMRTVDQYDYDINKGAISNKKVIFKLDDHKIPGIPDGMTIDTAGNLWVAVYDGSCVLHIDPRTSQLLSKIDLPAKQITSVAFGGPNMDILYVTSAQLPVNGVKPEEPAGSVFKITGTGAKGLPPTNVKLDQ